MANHFRIIKDQREDLYDIYFDFLDRDNAFAELLDVRINKKGKLEKRSILVADYPRDNFFLRMLSYDYDTNVTKTLSFFPCSDKGIKREVKIKEINEKECGAEASIVAELNNGESFEFFDSKYFMYKHSYCIDESYDFKFYGISTYVTKDDENDVEELNDTTANKERSQYKDCKRVYFSTDGKKLAVENTAGIPDEYVFRTQIEKVETLNYAGKCIYRIECGILNSDTSSNFLRINLYASDKTIRKGYIPKPGDSIKGHLWLCGLRDEDLPFKKP
jgi:hypothetical protein